MPGLWRRLVEAAQTVVPNAQIALVPTLSPSKSINQPPGHNRAGAGAGAGGAVDMAAAMAAFARANAPVLVRGRPGGRQVRLAGDSANRWVLVLGLQSRRGQIGNLVVVLEPEAAPFGLVEEQMLVSLSGLAAAGADSLGVFEVSQRRQQWLEAASDISHLLTAPEVDELRVWQRIAGHVHHLTAARTVTIATPSSTDPALMKVVVAAGVGAEELVGHTFPAAGSASGEAVTSQRGQVLAGAAGLFCVHSRSDPNDDLGEVMTVPLTGAGGTTGAVVVSRRHGDPPFTASDLELAKDFAGQAAIALERAAARTAHHRLATLDERDRIAADLHDHVISDVFVVGLQLQAAAATTTQPQLRSRLHAQVTALDDTIRRIRATIYRLQHTDLLTVDPHATVQVVLQDLAPLQLPVTVHTSGADQLLPVDVAADLQAVLREALVNVHRHADAHTVHVHVGTEDGQLVLTVADDGVGLGTSTRRSGLANLRSRAARHDGFCQLIAGPAGGLQLTWAVPLPQHTI